MANETLTPDEEPKEETGFEKPEEKDEEPISPWQGCLMDYTDR